MFCIVKGCPSSVERSTDPDLVFYPLPWHNIQLRTEWVKLCGYNPFNADDVKHITKDHRVCSLHFDNDTLELCFSNQEVLMPTLHLPTVGSDKKKKPISSVSTPSDEMWLKCIQTANITRISPPLTNPVTRQTHSPPKPIPPEDNPIPEKRIKKELDSNSCILEEKSYIAQNSVTIKPEPVEFAESLESAQSLESAKPLESAQSLESAKPFESAQSLESAKPFESAQSLESAKPFESAQSLESAKQFESAQSLESAKLFESAESLESAKPFESAQSLESSKPFEFAQSLESAKPFDSTQSLESVKPFQYIQPLESAEPVKSPLSNVFTQIPSIPSKSLSKRIMVVCNHHRSIMTRLSSLWKAGKLCDAIISNGSTHLKIHQIVLSAASPKMLRVFDKVCSDKGLTVTVPTTTSSEALIAFTEYLYNGVLAMDARILGELKAVAHWLEMDDFAELCNDQLKVSPLADEMDERSEELPADVKQKGSSSSDTEDLNSDLGIVIEGYSLADDTAMMDTKEDTENNCLRIKVEPEDPEELMYENKETNGDDFLPDSSRRNCRKVKLIPKPHTYAYAHAQSSTSSSYLSFLSPFHSELPTHSSAPIVYESKMRPVGYITSTSKQKLITPKKTNMAGTCNSEVLTVILNKNKNYLQ